MIEQTKILTVSELTKDIKEVVSTIFAGVAVEGEISNFRAPSSGHLYFSLKDQTSQVKCVFFKNEACGLKFSPQDGIKVICFGRVSVYEKEGQYQLYVSGLEPKGEGALALAFAQTKKRLEAEGLFGEARKRPLPFCPETVGVITSPTGAVIRDILSVLERRFPGFHVIIYPVCVQGAGSKEEVVEAIKGFNALKNVEVIILARGGGSLEDLWCFNEEAVARAIFESAIPIVSAIGHETDYTIADFTADCRAATPSVAAEMVLPQVCQLEQRIDDLLCALWRNLTDIPPQYAQKIDDLREELTRALTNRLDSETIRLDGVLNELNALNPLAILKRGYSITSILETGSILYRAQGLAVGSKLKTRLSEGEFVSQVIDI